MNKTEEPWTDKICEYFEDLISECELHTDLNNDSGYHFQRKRNQWGVAGTIIPIVSSPLTLMTSYATQDTCNTITATDYLSCITLLVSGIVAGVNTFYNFGQRTNQHLSVALMFEDIKSEIIMQTRFSAINRPDADVFMMKINMLIGNAARQEPMIPLSILKKYKTSKKMIKNHRNKLLNTQHKISPMKTSSTVNNVNNVNNGSTASESISDSEHGIHISPDRTELHIRKNNTGI